MDSTHTQALNIPVKPIILNILPVNNTSPSNSVHSPNSVINDNLKVNNRANRNTVTIPQFNHSPIVPTLVDTGGSIASSAITRVDKELERLQRQRQSSSKYYNRVKEYKRIGSLNTEKEKVIALLLLCYPQFSALESYELDQLVTNFIRDLENVVATK